MPIAAGKLRHRITIQRETTTRDEFGSEVKTWVTLAQVWAAIDPLSPTAMAGVKEGMVAGADLSQDMVRVTLRPRDVTAKDRFLFRDRIHNVKAARLDNANGAMTLFADVGSVAPANNIVTFALLTSGGDFLLTSDGGKLLGVAA